MGGNQSTNAGATAAQATEVKTSYYELLNVERTASDEEIKKAYRKRALELHPDRNYGDVERATKLFAEIQAAYEVLSDPQERAWYDSHEQIILKGQDPEEANYEHEMGITSTEEIAAMMRKFNRNVDFSDGPSGFYGFLRDTFEKLAKEENAAAYHQGLDERDYPTFGHKEDEYEDVVKEFYVGWSSFSTVKTFGWKHKYRKTDAEDRWTRRAIDKENARFSDQGKKEFNEAVRQLVAFVRKRDPRYTPPSDAEREKAMRQAAKVQAAKQRAEYEAKLNQEVPEWATRREPDELDEEEEEEIEEEHYECMACHKTFKSEKQFDAHEKSKKHQKAMAALKKRMRKENAHLGLEDEFSSSDVATPAEVAESDSGEDLANEMVEQVDESLNSSTNDPTHALHEPMEKLIVSDDEHHDDVDDADEGIQFPNGRTQKGGGGANHEEEHDSDKTNETDEDDGATATTRTLVAAEADTINTLADTTSAQVRQAPKMGKAAQKRAKRAAQEAADEQDELKFKCATCNSGFPSKTRLFQHIKDFDHAAPVAAGTKKGKAGKGKKR